MIYPGPTRCHSNITLHRALSWEIVILTASAGIWPWASRSSSSGPPSLPPAQTRGEHITAYSRWKTSESKRIVGAFWG